MAAGSLILLGGIWLVVTGLLARREAGAIQADLRRLEAQANSGDLVAARASAAALQSHAHRAHLLTTGPAWALAAPIPGVGSPLQVIRGTTADVDTAVHAAVPQLVTASRQLDPAITRRADGSFDLARVAAAQPYLDRALSTLSAAVSSVQGLPHSTWLTPVDTARTNLAVRLQSLVHTVRSADLTARVAPAMLGADGVQRYFVAFQNEAEARGTGGLIGVFAIMRADHGKVSFERFETDTALHRINTGLDFGAAYDQLFHGGESTSLFSNANLSPNFPYAAQVWAAMWAKRSGEHLNGAIAVDPTVLSHFLAVTGPVRLSDGTLITAKNAVSLTESTVYSRFSDNRQRRTYLRDVAHTISQNILDRPGATRSLLRAAARSAGERRLLLYSADPGIEAELAQTSLAGTVPATQGPYVGMSVVNDGGNKLDYYLDRSLSWQRTGCGSTREVTVTIRLTNNARSGLPAYVTHRSDRHSYPVRPGDTRLLVAYYATHGALMRSVTLNGQPSTAMLGSQSGHPVFTVDVEIPRGRTSVIVLHLIEPGVAGAPTVLKQPLVRPLHVSLSDANCG